MPEPKFIDAPGPEEVSGPKFIDAPGPQVGSRFIDAEGPDAVPVGLPLYKQPGTLRPNDEPFSFTRDVATPILAGINKGIVTPSQQIVYPAIGIGESALGAAKDLLGYQPGTSTTLNEALTRAKERFTKVTPETHPLTKYYESQMQKTGQFFAEDMKQAKPITDQSGNVLWANLNPVENPWFYTNMATENAPMMGVQMVAGWRAYNAAIQAGASELEASRQAAALASRIEGSQIAADEYQKGIEKGLNPIQATVAAAAVAVPSVMISSGVPGGKKLLSKLEQKGIKKGLVHKGAQVLAEGTEGIMFGTAAKLAKKKGLAARAARAGVGALTEGLEELGQEEVAMGVERAYDKESYKDATARRISSFLGGAMLGAPMAAIGGPTIDPETGEVVEQPAPTAPAPEQAAAVATQKSENLDDIKRLTEERDGLLKEGSSESKAEAKRLTTLIELLSEEAGQEVPSAIQEPSPTTEVPRAGTEGAVVPEGGEGVRPGIEGQEAAREGQTKTQEVAPQLAPFEQIRQQIPVHLQDRFDADVETIQSKRQEIQGRMDALQAEMDANLGTATREAVTKKGAKRQRVSLDKLKGIQARYTFESENMALVDKAESDLRNKWLGAITSGSIVAQETQAPVSAEPVTVKLKNGSKIEFSTPGDVAQVQSMREDLRQKIDGLKQQSMTSEERKKAIAGAISEFDSAITGLQTRPTTDERVGERRVSDEPVDVDRRARERRAAIRAAAVGDEVIKHDTLMKDLADRAAKREKQNILETEEAPRGPEVAGLYGEAGERVGGKPVTGGKGPVAVSQATVGEVESTLSGARSYAGEVEEGSHGYRPVADFIDGNRERAKRLTTQDGRDVTYVADKNNLHALIGSKDAAPTAVVLTRFPAVLVGAESSVAVDDLYKAPSARGKGSASSDYKAMVELARQIHPQADSLAGFAIGDGSFGHRITYPNTEMMSDLTPFLLKTPFSDIESGERVSMSKAERSQLMDDMRGGLTTAEARARLQEMRKKGGAKRGASKDVASLFGGQELYEAAIAKLGLGPDATVGEIAAAVKAKIGSLGKTVKETAVKIINKIKGIGREAANALAKMLHEIQPFQGRQGEIGGIGKVAPWQPKIITNATSDIAGKSIPTSKDVDAVTQAAMREIANIKPGDIPKGIDPKLLMGYGKKLAREYTTVRVFNTDITPARGLMSPAIIAMRSKALQGVNRTVNRFVAKIERVLQSFNDPLQAMASLSRASQKKVTVALIRGTLANGGKGKKWSNAELVSQFGLNESEIMAYNSACKQMVAIRGQLIESERVKYMRQRDRAKKLMGEAKTETDMARVRQTMEELDNAFIDLVKNYRNEAYFPLRRFGSRIVKVLDSEGKQIAMSLVDKLDDKSVAEALAEITEQDEKVKEIIASGQFTVESMEMPKLDFLKNNGGAIFDGAFMRYLTAAKNIDPSLLTEIELAAANAYLQDTWQNHMQHRTGLPGYSTDGLKVLQTFARTAANRIANNTMADAMEDAVRAMGREAMGNEYDSTLESEARNIVNSARNPPYHPIANMLTGMAFINFLGFRIGFAITNLTQQGTMGFPVFSSLYKPRKVAPAMVCAGRIASRIISGSGLLKTTGMEALTDQQLSALIDKNIKPDDFRMVEANALEREDLAKLVKSVLHDAVRDGELRAKIADELMSQRDKTTAGGKAANVLEKTAEYAGIVASKSEQFNRVSTLITYLTLAHQNGEAIMDEAGTRVGPKLRYSEDTTKAREATEVMNRIINFASGRGNLSPYQRVGGSGGGMLRVATQFKRFIIDQHTALYNLGVLNYRAEKARNANAAKKAYAAARPLLSSWMVCMMLGGPAAVPAWGILKALLKTIFGEDYPLLEAEARKKLEETIRVGVKDMKFSGDSEKLVKQLTFAAENGLPNLLGVNMNAALTMNMIPGKDNESWAATAGRVVAGPSAGSVLDVLDSLQSPKDSAFDTLMQASPLEAKNIQQAVSGKAKFGREGIEMSPLERGMKAASLAPSRVGMVHQAKGEAVKIAMAKKSLVTKLTEEFGDAAENDRERILNDVIIPRVQKWNERVQELGYPQSMINPSSIVTPVLMEATRNAPVYERAGVEERK